MVDTPVKAQTWADNSKEIVASVADWMLVECVVSNTRWNSLTDGDGLVLRGMELVEQIAVHRGIPLGTVTLAPGDLLKAMQDQAKASLAPTHPLPVTSAVVTSGGLSSTTVTSGGTETPVASGGVSTPVVSSATVTSGGTATAP